MKVMTRKFSFSKDSKEVQKLKIQLFFMKSKIALGETIPPNQIRDIKKSIARELSKARRENA
jgi:ribosomal protein L29